MPCVVLRTGRRHGESLSTNRIHARDFVRAVSWTRRNAREPERAGKSEAVGPGDCESGEAAARSATGVVLAVSWRDRSGEGSAVLVHGGGRARRFSETGDSER